MAFVRICKLKTRAASPKAATSISIVKCHWKVCRFWFCLFCLSVVTPGGWSCKDSNLDGLAFNVLFYCDVENAELQNFGNILNPHGVENKINISIITTPTWWLQINIYLYIYIYIYMYIYGVANKINSGIITTPPWWLQIIIYIYIYIYIYG